MRKTMMTAVALLGLFAAGEAMALGVNYGLRLGTGTGFDRDDKLGDDASIFPFAIGPAVKLSLPLVAVEINALYWSTTTESTVLGNTIEAVDNELALPIIGRLSFPIVPVLFDLQLGLGLEPRFHLSTTVDGEDVDQDDRQMVMYLPISVAGDLNLGVASVNVEIRYEYQLTDRQKENDRKIDYFTFFGGIFF